MIEALNTPWKVVNEVRRRTLMPFARAYFAIHGVNYGRDWRLFGLPIIQKHRLSTIQIGDELELRSWYGSNPLVPTHPVLISTRSAGAIIRIGNNCGFTGSVVVAADQIIIGDRVIVGANSVIMDTDFHPLDYELRISDMTNADHSPVVIEDDVFIGMSAIVMKGLRIGRGAVIGAGSVVTRDVEPHTLVAGNPARIIRKLK